MTSIYNGSVDLYITAMGSNKRVQFIGGDTTGSGGKVAYWMQAAVRTRFNHALEYAVHLANHRRVPLNVFFVLTPDYPSASTRHYRFLIEGLIEVESNLRARGIPFTVLHGDPPATVMRHIRDEAVSTLVTDRGYTRVQRRWRETVAREIPCPFVQIETNVVVPVEVTSTKEEYSAATIRPKINRHRDDELRPVKPVPYWDASSLRPPSNGSRPETTSRLLEMWPLKEHPVPFTGGENQAAVALRTFLEERLLNYAERRNIPDQDGTSRLSPYLHFGQISPIEIALGAIERAEESAETGLTQDVETLLEELIVRRELAINFTWYNPHYDSFSCLPDWARKTLQEHSGDDRPAIYTARQLESAETHDPYWNAAQRQMVESGMMHGYMRMYWGKKILEWTRDPEDAFLIALELNDRYELDGRDPNGYAGVAWCFGKHDRPWVERPVFGKVRYMNDRGLKRKFKQIDRYVTRWSR